MYQVSSEAKVLDRMQLGDSGRHVTYFIYQFAIFLIVWIF
jgi:hypothetical protein